MYRVFEVSGHRTRPDLIQLVIEYRTQPIASIVYEPHAIPHAITCHRRVHMHVSYLSSHAMHGLFDRKTLIVE